MIDSSSIKKHLLFVKNLLYLIVNKVANFILPLIYTLYLLKVVGVEKYGAIIFSQTIGYYFQIFIDYGFSVSGAKQIIDNSDNKTKINEISSAIQIARVILILILFVVLLIVIYSVDRIYEVRFLVGLFFISAIAQNFSSFWYFQGLQKFKHVSILSMTVRVLSFIGVVFLIRKEEDYMIFGYIYSISFIIPAIYSLYHIYIVDKVKFVLVPFSEIKYQIKNSFSFFVSVLSNSLITYNIVAILGLKFDDYTVGIYGSAERIVKAVMLFNHPFSHALFPYMGEMQKKNPQKAQKFGLRIGFIAVSIMFLAAVLGYYFAPTILIQPWALGNRFVPSVPYFQFLCLTLPFEGFLRVYCSTLIILQGRNKLYLWVNLFILAINLLLTPIFLDYFGLYGACISFILTSAIPMFILIYFIHFNNNKRNENVVEEIL